MQKASMRTSNDGKRTERRRNRTTAAPLQGNSTDRDHALGLARGFGAAGLRTTLGWQIARTLFRIGFAGALAVFAGRLIEDDAIST